MIRRPPRSTLDRSSAASDVYKRQDLLLPNPHQPRTTFDPTALDELAASIRAHGIIQPVSYTHLRAHETVLDLVCRLLLENTNNTTSAHDTSTSDPDEREQKQSTSIGQIATIT